MCSVNDSEALIAHSQRSAILLHEISSPIGRRRVIRRTGMPPTSELVNRFALPCGDADVDEEQNRDHDGQLHAIGFEVSRAYERGAGRGTAWL